MKMKSEWGKRILSMALIVLLLVQPQLVYGTGDSSGETPETQEQGVDFSTPQPEDGNVENAGNPETPGESEPQENAGSPETPGESEQQENAGSPETPGESEPQEDTGNPDTPEDSEDLEDTENPEETEDSEESDATEEEQVLQEPSDGSLAGQTMKFVNLYWETDDLGTVEAVFGGGADEELAQVMENSDRGVYTTVIPSGDYSRVSFRKSGESTPLAESSYNYYGAVSLDGEVDTTSFIAEKNNTFYYDLGENPSYWGADPEYEVTDPGTTVTVPEPPVQISVQQDEENPGQEEGEEPVKSIAPLMAPATRQERAEEGNPQPGEMVYAIDLDKVEEYAATGATSENTYRINIAFMRKGHDEIGDIDQLPEEQGEIYTMYEKSPGVYSAPFPKKTEEYSEVGFKLIDKDSGNGYTLKRHYNFRGETPEENGQEASKFGYFKYYSGYTDTYYMNNQQNDSYWGAHPSNADQSLDTQVLYVDVEDHTGNNIVADIEKIWISWKGMPEGSGENFNSEKGYKVTSTLPYDSIRYFQFPKNSNATENTILTLHFKLKALNGKELTEEQKNTEYTYKFTLIPRSQRNRLNMDYIWEFTGKIWDHFEAGEALDTREIFFDNLRTGYEEVWMRVAKENGGYADKTAIAAWPGWDKDKIDKIVEEIKDTSGNVTSTWLKMNAVEDPGQYDKEKLFQLNIPGDYTKIQFRGVLKKDDNKKIYYSNQETVTKEVAYPCYFAYQTGEPSEAVPEGDVEKPGITGYWTSVYSVNTAGDESIDIPQGEIQWEEGVYYADSTFYDYYSDWEMTGRKVTDWTSFEGDEWTKQAKNINTALDGYYREAVEDVDISKLRAFYLSGDAYKTDAVNLLTGDELWNKDINRQNQWTGENQGPIYKIVANKLSDNGNMLLNEKVENEMKTTNVEHPLFDESFLRGDNNLDTAVGNVYNNVKFPIRPDTDPSSDTYGYWVYNSANVSDAFRLTYDVDEGYFLKRTNEGIPLRYGLNSFFPFNDKADFNSKGNIENERQKVNYMFSMKMEFPFAMTEDGYVYQDKNGDGKLEENLDDPEKNEKLPITFEFQGDDDVWIFIDGILALDLGGIHDAVRGTINLTDGTWEVKRSLKDGNSYEGEGIDAGSGRLPRELQKLLADRSRPHKLTMFYMERGLWESNLKLTFNFPRDNRFIVEKEVDVQSTRQPGDDIFAGLLENIGSFNFNIKNQATSGETLSIEESSGHKQPGENTPLFSAGNVDADFAFVNAESGIVTREGDGTRKVDQTALVVGDTPKADTLLKVTPKSRSILSVADKDYLRLSMKNLGTTDRNANNLYLSFVDTAGRRVGGYAGALGYNGESNTFLTNEESIIRVNFKEMTGDPGFDWNQVAYMLIGIRRMNSEDSASYEISYASFYEKMEERPHEGFYVDDIQISDYGSVKSGKLEPVDGAWYVKQNKKADGSYDSGVSWNTEGGTFNLADGQRAVFTDRFRTGSYIALNENREQKIFDTEWTLKEGEQEIPAKYLLSSRHDITTVKNPLDVISKEYPLSGVKGDVVNDGREEIVDSGWASVHLDFQQPTEENTLVYRSYQDPDSSANIGTDLCVTVKNTLKRGSLTIKKQLTEGSANDEKQYKPAEFTFKIYYTNIAGRGLEKQLAPIDEENRYLLQTVTVKTDETGKGEITIPNIPAGTQYHIVEVPANGTKLVDIQIGSKDSEALHENVGVHGVVGEGENVDYGKAYVQGTAYASNQVVTFINQIVPFYMDIEKIWKDGLEDEDRKIQEVHIQLQRRIQGSESEWMVVTKDYFDNPIPDVKGDYIVLNSGNNWKNTSKMALPVGEKGTDKLYEYRIVEMNHDNIFQSYEVTYDYVRNEDFRDVDGNKFLYVTYQAINTPAQLQLKKIWTNPEDGNSLSRIRVKLLASTNKKGEAKDWVCYKKLTNEHHQCTNSCYIELSSAGDWSTSMRNLPVQREEEKPYYYKLAEEQIFIDGSWKAAEQSQICEVTYGEPVTLKQDGEDIPTVQATNKMLLGSIQIIKEDENKKPLKDAEFKIERLKEKKDETDKRKWEVDEEWQFKTATTDSEGKISFETLPYGTYRITETKAPHGYLLNPEGIIITIPCKDSNLDAGPEDVEVEVTDGGNGAKHHIVLTIKNSKLYELPNSGGSGIYRYMISGVLLMIAAVFIIYNNKRKGVKA